MVTMWAKVEKIGDYVRDCVCVAVSLAERNVVEDMLVIRIVENFVVRRTLNYFIATWDVGSQLFKMLVRKRFDLKLFLEVNFICVPFFLMSCR